MIKCDYQTLVTEICNGGETFCGHEWYKPKTASSSDHFLCMYLAISMPWLISTHSNVLPKQVPRRHHFAGPPSPHRVLPTVCTAQDDCDWFKEIQTGQSVFFLL